MFSNRPIINQKIKLGLRNRLINFYLKTFLQMNRRIIILLDLGQMIKLNFLSNYFLNYFYEYMAKAVILCNKNIIHRNGLQTVENLFFINFGGDQIDSKNEL